MDNAAAGGLLEPVDGVAVARGGDVDGYRFALAGHVDIGVGLDVTLVVAEETVAAAAGAGAFEDAEVEGRGVLDDGGGVYGDDGGRDFHGGVEPGSVGAVNGMEEVGGDDVWVPVEGEVALCARPGGDVELEHLGRGGAPSVADEGGAGVEDGGEQCPAEFSADAGELVGVDGLVGGEVQGVAGGWERQGVCAARAKGGRWGGAAVDVEVRVVQDGGDVHAVGIAVERALDGDVLLADGGDGHDLVADEVLSAVVEQIVGMGDGDGEVGGDDGALEVAGGLASGGGAAVGLSSVELHGEGDVGGMSVDGDLGRDGHGRAVLRGHDVHAVERGGLVGAPVEMLVLSGKYKFCAEGVTSLEGICFGVYSGDAYLVIGVDGLRTGDVDAVVEHGVHRAVLNGGDEVGEINGDVAFGGDGLLDGGEGCVGGLRYGDVGGREVGRRKHEFDGPVEVRRVVPLAYLRRHKPERGVQLGMQIRTC